MNAESVSIRPARREDVAAIVTMLADDHLGSARRARGRPVACVLLRGIRAGRARSKYPACGCRERGQGGRLPATRDPAGSQLARRPARSARRRPRRFRLPQPRHWRAIGAMGGDGSESARLQSGRAADASDANRCAALLQAAWVHRESRRHDCPLLTQRAMSLARSAKSDCAYVHVKS